MTLFIWTCVGFAVGVCLLVALFAYGLCKAAGKPAPMPPGLAKLYPWWLGGEKPVQPEAAGKAKRKPWERGTCPACRRELKVNSVGDPIRRHICTFGSPWQLKKAAAPVRPTVAERLETWPPAPKEE